MYDWIHSSNPQFYQHPATTCPWCATRLEWGGIHLVASSMGVHSLFLSHFHIRNTEMNVFTAHTPHFGLALIMFSLSRTHSGSSWCTVNYCPWVPVLSIPVIFSWSKHEGNDKLMERSMMSLPMWLHHPHTSKEEKVIRKCNFLLDTWGWSLTLLYILLNWLYWFSLWLQFFKYYQKLITVTGAWTLSKAPRVQMLIMLIMQKDVPHHYTVESIPCLVPPVIYIKSL